MPLIMSRNHFASSTFSVDCAGFACPGSSALIRQEAARRERISVKSVKSVVHSLFMKHEEHHRSGGGVAPELQGIETGMEARFARATGVSAGRRTTDFTDYSDGDGNERGLVPAP